MPDDVTKKPAKAAIVTDHRRHAVIHLRAPGFIRFTARGDQQSVELFIEEPSIVPVSGRQIRC